ncbi:hypothetical protein, partial [Neptunomonas phycophila]|uniref:hypothetical protein n=1 Tax=Neptunomonas phycophila TaxID=1572645 RepID=UPI001C37665A
MLKAKSFKRSFYTGLTTCANGKTCPVCSSVINERKSNEMRIAANQAQAMNLSMSLLTFTVPHTVGDKVDVLVPKVLEACRRF